MRPLIEPTLLLKIFQSIELNTPVLVELATSIPNTPDTLLYVSGPSTEREVSDIFVARAPDTLDAIPERLARLEFAISRAPEML